MCVSNKGSFSYDMFGLIYKGMGKHPLTLDCLLLLDLDSLNSRLSQSLYPLEF